MFCVLLLLLVTTAAVMAGGASATPCYDSAFTPQVELVSKGKGAPLWTTVNLAPSEEEPSILHFVPPHTGVYFVISPQPHVSIAVLQGANCDFPLNVLKQNNIAAASNPYFSGFDGLTLVEGELYTLRIGAGAATVHVGLQYASYMLWHDGGLLKTYAAIMIVFLLLNLGSCYMVLSDPKYQFDDADEPEEEVAVVQTSSTATNLVKRWTVANFAVLHLLAGTVWSLPQCFPLAVLIALLCYRDMEHASSTHRLEHAVLIILCVVNWMLATQSLVHTVQQTWVHVEQCDTVACRVHMWLIPATGMVSFVAQLVLLPVYLRRRHWANLDITTTTTTTINEKEDAFLAAPLLLPLEATNQQKLSLSRDDDDDDDMV